MVMCLLNSFKELKCLFNIIPLNYCQSRINLMYVTVYLSNIPAAVMVLTYSYQAEAGDHQ